MTVGENTPSNIKLNNLKAQVDNLNRFQNIFKNMLGLWE